MSGPESRFFYIQAGSFEVAYRALKRANPEKRKYCVLLSHSGINELDNKWPIDVDDPTHVENLDEPRSRGMVDCVNPIHPPAGKPSGLGAGYYFTSKQGVADRRPQFGNKTYKEGWEIVDWMSTSPHRQYQWVYARCKTAMDAKKCAGLDASDGGIVFALVTGKHDHGVDGGFVALTEFLDKSLTLPESPTPKVTRLELININTNAVIQAISNGDVIDPSSLSSNVTIRAMTDPVTIESVAFKEGATVLNNDEVGSLYTINENSDGRIAQWGYTRREYNLEVVPQLNGKTGPSYTVSFTIGEGSDGSKPTVSTPSPAGGAKTAAFDGPVFVEENGLVVMEAESLKLPAGWSEERTIPGYMGEGYLVYTGEGYMRGPGDETLTYKVQITKTGTYEFAWHCRNGEGAEKGDKENDTWLKIDADEFTKAVRDKSKRTTQFEKVHLSSLGEWNWLGHKPRKQGPDASGVRVFAKFNQPGVYEILISGRSTGHTVDRLVLWHSDVDHEHALATATPESQIVVGGRAVDEPTASSISPADR